MLACVWARRPAVFYTYGNRHCIFISWNLHAACDVCIFKLLARFFTLNKSTQKDLFTVPVPITCVTEIYYMCCRTLFHVLQNYITYVAELYSVCCRSTLCLLQNCITYVAKLYYICCINIFHVLQNYVTSVAELYSVC